MTVKKARIVINKLKDFDQNEFCDNVIFPILKLLQDNNYNLVCSVSPKKRY